jgi:hypothetical protein
MTKEDEIMPLRDPGEWMNDAMLLAQSPFMRDTSCSEEEQPTTADTEVVSESVPDSDAHGWWM